MHDRTKLEQDIREFCSINNISDPDEFIYKCMLNGFNISKYGISPQDNIKRQSMPVSVDDKEVNNEPVIVKKKRKITVTNK